MVGGEDASRFDGGNLSSREVVMNYHGLNFGKETVPRIQHIRRARRKKQKNRIPEIQKRWQGGLPQRGTAKHTGLLQDLKIPARSRSTKPKGAYRWGWGWSQPASG